MTRLERPKGADYWSRKWGVHRNTARRLLRYLHRQYGAKVVWRVGPEKAFVATEASMQLVRVFRTGDRLVLVLQDASAGHQATANPTSAVHRSRSLLDGDEPVTQEQLSRALGEVWRAIAEVKSR